MADTDVLFIPFSVGNVAETPSQAEPVGSRTGLHTAGKIQFQCISIRF